MTQQEAPNPFSSPLRIRRMLTNTPPALHHVLPGLLQGTVGMVAASGGTGKSTFLLQLAFALASGASVCGGLFSDVAPECARKSEPVKVVYVAAEESETLLWHRMHAVVSHLFETDYPHLEQAEREELLNLFEQNVILFPLQGMSRTLLLDEVQQPTEAFWQLVQAPERGKSRPPHRPVGYGGGLPPLKAPTTFQLKSSTARKFLRILSYQELLNPKIRILTCWGLNPQIH